MSSNNSSPDNNKSPSSDESIGSSPKAGLLRRFNAWTGSPRHAPPITTWNENPSTSSGGARSVSRSSRIGDYDLNQPTAAAESPIAAAAFAAAAAPEEAQLDSSNNDDSRSAVESTSGSDGSLHYYGWEEVDLYVTTNDTDSPSSDEKKKQKKKHKGDIIPPNSWAPIGRFTLPGLSKTKKKSGDIDTSEEEERIEGGGGEHSSDSDIVDGQRKEKNGSSASSSGIQPSSYAGSRTMPTETNTGTRLSDDTDSDENKTKKKKKKKGGDSSHDPQFQYATRTKDGKEIKTSGEGGVDSDETSDDSSTSTKAAGAFWACCRRMPLLLPLLLLLLLLLSAAIAITVVLVKRPPMDGDKQTGVVTGEPKSIVPTFSPTSTPLLEACVCYPLLQEENLSEQENSSSPTYNIGGTNYKCLEEQNLSEEDAQSQYLTICVFPNPSADPNLMEGYSFGNANNNNDDGSSNADMFKVTTTGDLSVPNLNQEVEVFAVTTTGSFSVDNLDTSSLNEMQLADVMGYFEDSIAAELDLPPGSTVTITSIDNGVVQYEIVTYNESSADANAAASTIHPTLSQTSTLDNISNSVLTASQGSSDAAIQSGMALIDVASHTAGITSSPISISKITTTGQFSVEGFDPSSFSVAQMDEAKEYFESAITQELESQGLLPEGSSVVVTNLTSGIVEYEIHFYGQTSAQASAAISSVATALSSNSTLESISSTVQTESSSSTTGISTSMSSVSITGNTQTGTTGLTMTAAEEEEAKGYYEDAITSILGPLLPNGATVLVTDIANGVVSYEISMDVNSSEGATSTVDVIQSFLSETSTLEAISMYVEEVSSSSSNQTIVNSLLGATVTSNTTGSTTNSPNQTIVNSLLGATVTSNTTGSTTELSSVNLPLLGMTVTSNTPGTTNIIESTPSNVTFNNLTMEISLDGTSLTTHDLLSQDKGDGGPLYDTVQDSSGTLMAFTINKPISSFSPLDEGFALANEMEVCSSVPLEPNQLVRPEVGGESMADGESEALLRPESRKLHTSSLHFPRDLQQQLVEEVADFCLSISLGSPSSQSSDSPAAVPPSGLQV